MNIYYFKPLRFKYIFVSYSRNEPVSDKIEGNYSNKS